MATKYAEFGSTPLASDQVTPEDLAASQPSEFTRGARAATYGMGSGLRNAVGAVADAFDFDNFAAQQYGEADRLSLRAQQTGPRIGSLDQLKQGGYNLRDVGDYVAGVVGGAGPSIALGVGSSLAARGAPLASLAAGTATFAPLEVGDAVAKWRAANPGQQIDGDTMLRLGATGLGSAALQSVVPAMVGGKILGRGPASMPATSLRQAAGRNLAEIPMDGLTEGAGEYIKQAGATPELPTDWGQVGENALTGSISGVPMAGLGAAGDYAHGNARSMSDAVGRGVAAARGAMSSAANSARGAADAAQETTRNAWDGVADVAKAAYDGTVEGFKTSDLGKTLGDRANTVRDWATEILEDPTTPDTVREGVRNAVTRAGDKVNQAYVWAAKQARDAQSALTKPKDETTETPSDALRTLRTQPDDTVDKVIGDGFLGDNAEMATATADRAAELSQESAAKGAEFATKWGNELLGRAGVSEETKAQVTEALRNVGDRASQVTIATAKKAADAADGVRTRAKAFADGIKKGMRDRAPEDSGPKKSEDYSGARKAVNDVLAKYRQDVPEAVLDDPETSAMLADSLREFVKIAARPGAFDTIDKHWVRAQLGGLLGPRSTDILNEVWDAVGSSEPDAVARRYQTLNDLDDMNKQAMSLTTVLQSALPEGSPLAARQAEDADVLTRWARGELTKKMSPEQVKFEDRRMQEYIQETYGEKAGVVLAALEQRTKAGRDMQHQRAVADDLEGEIDEFDGSVQIRDADAPNTSYVGGNKSGKVLVADPAVYRAKDKSGLEGSTERLIKKLKAENPGADVRFVSVVDKPELVDMIPSLKAKITKEKKALAEQYPGDADRQLAALEQFRDRMVADLKTEGMGMVEVASNPNPDALTQADIEAMRLDTERYGKADNPARLEVPDGPIFDAVAVARTMRGKINKERTWTEEDDRSDGHRLARAFSDGVAALMEKYGRFKVSPDTLIGKVDGKDFFARDIKGLKKDAGQNFRDPRDGERDAPGTKRAPGDHKVQIRREANTEDLKSELDAVSRTIQSMEAEDGDPRTLNRLYDREAKLIERLDQASMTENAEDAAEAIGQQNVDPANDNIVKAGAALSQRQLQRPPQSGTANDKAPNTKPLIALAERIRESNAPAREKIADRLQTLALNASMMGKEDLQRLMDLKMATKVSEVSGTVNELARKYADKIVAPKGADVSGSEVLSREKTPERGAMSSARAATARERNKDGVFGEKVMTDAELRARISAVKKSTAERVGALKAADKDIAFLQKLDPAIRRSEEKDLIDPELAVLERELASRTEGPTDPKAVAAKKAAFLEKAASGDATLIKELKASADAKGLQRAVEALNAAELTDANEANIIAAVEAINDRLTQLVQDPDVAYGMGTKKYSLLSTQVHNDLKRGGFAATHDSPIRHEGKFNWREHTGKGEGNAAFGAGTYLSTGEGVHKYYKKMFSGGRVQSEMLQDALVQAREDAGAAPTAADIREAVEESLRDGLEGNDGYYDQQIRQALAELKRMTDASVKGDSSPTYHVSVGAMKAQLLNWDKPLNEQSSYVKKRLEEFDGKKGGKPEWHDPTGGGKFAEAVSHAGIPARVVYDKRSQEYEVFFGWEDELIGAASSLAEAKKIAENALNMLSTPLGADIYRALTARLGSQAAASDYLQSLGILGHEYAAANGRDSTTPNYVIYDDSKIETNYVHFSAQRATGAGMSPKGQRQVMDAINTMLGNSVKAEFKNLPHAGEFETVGADDIIRVSVHALNPTTVAYHESLHALFAKLMREGSGDVADVLMRATQRPAVAKRLRELLAGEPAALRQLRDPEERAAYMFQFWADGDAQLIAALKGQPQTILQRIADTLRRVLGIWSNEDRALHIMEAFSSGEFAQNLGNPGAFRRAVMAPGRNKAVEAARSLTKPFTELGEAVVAAGSARLRDSRIPSLVELADTVKAPLTEETADPGYLPAARLERTRVLNDLGAKLADLPKETIAEALEILQTGSTQSTTPEARLAAREVRKVLADQLAYLQKAGVNVGNLGPDYFPRVYDATYISKHQDEFQAVLDKYGVQGDTMHKIIASGGTELGIEVDRPGMQAKKARKLDMIPDAELAPFMQKDLYQILNSYVTQATRRAEWARRFGDDSARYHELLAEAKKQGATKDQLDAAEKYVKGVNGTLGDGINPTARRLMGDMIVYQNIRLLPLAIFSSVVDPMGVLVRGGEVKDAWNTFKRGIREIPKGLRGDTSLDESARIADTLGVIDNAALVHDLGALYSQGMVGNTARKVNDAFFRFNLMEQFNRSMRVGATEAALKFMERHSTGTTSTHSARWMRELGLMRGDVQVVNGRVALTQADGLTAAQEVRIRTAVNRWVDGAVLRPDAADRPIWMNDPHWALVAHLKQFVYAFHHTILKRVGHEMRNGNYAPTMALASYVPIMIASDAAKGMLQNGGDEPEWKKNWGMEDYIAHGVQRAGLLGVGQLGVDAYTDVQRGGTGVGALAGPTLEQMGDAMQVLGGNKQFGSFALRAMPANALYSGYLNEERADLSTD